MRQLEYSELGALFIEELNDMYFSEVHILKVLPKIKKAANSQAVQTAITYRYKLSKEDCKPQLRAIFAILGVEPNDLAHDSLSAVLENGLKRLGRATPGTTASDVAITVLFNKIATHENIVYSGLIGLSALLGLDSITEKLTRISQLKRQSDPFHRALPGRPGTIESGTDSQQQYQEK